MTIFLSVELNFEIGENVFQFANFLLRSIKSDCPRIFLEITVGTWKPNLKCFTFHNERIM